MNTQQTKILREDCDGKRELKVMIGDLLRKVRWSLILFWTFGGFLNFVITKPAERSHENIQNCENKYK
jgi:hypothetical protein